jgi:hypothetical protein
MTYAMLSNGKLRGPDGVSFPYDETDPRFADFLTWLQAGGTLVLVDEPPEPEVPAEIQMWQARAILSRVGLLNNVNQAVAASNNPEIQIAWEYAPNVVRRSVFVTSMATVLNIDDATIDNLFIEGAKIK